MSEISHVGEAVSSRKTASRRWSTRKIVILALFTALSLILSFVEVPLFVPFLKYDASAPIAAFAACGLGPAAGLVVGIASAIIHGLIMGDPWGSLMTIIALAFWIVPIALIWRAKKTLSMLVVALLVGSVLSLAAVIGGNLLITPIYTGTDMVQVAAMIVPILLPFNVLKLLINDFLVFVLNKPIQALMSGE